MTRPHCLLNLVVTPQIEDTVTDWLLAREDVTGFSNYPIFGHGSSIHSMTLAEQVAGKCRQVTFQLHLPKDIADNLLKDIKNDFSNSGLHYWLLTVSDIGYLE